MRHIAGVDQIAAVVLPAVPGVVGSGRPGAGLLSCNATAGLIPGFGNPVPVQNSPSSSMTGSSAPAIARLKGQLPGYGLLIGAVRRGSRHETEA